MRPLLLQLLGWYSAEGFPDGESNRVVPPPNVIKTARRVYRIVRTIDKVIKRPVEAVAAAEAAEASNQQPGPAEEAAPSKQPQQPAVPPSRYASVSTRGACGSDTVADTSAPPPPLPPSVQPLP